MPKRRATEAEVGGSTSTSNPPTAEMTAQELLDRRRAQNMLAQRRYREKNKLLKQQQKQQQQQKGKAEASTSQTRGSSSPNPPATSTSASTATTSPPISTSNPSSSSSSSNILNTNFFQSSPQSDTQFSNAPFQSSPQQNNWQHSIMHQSKALPWAVQTSQDTQMFDGNLAMGFGTPVGLDSDSSQTSGDGMNHPIAGESSGTGGGVGNGNVASGDQIQNNPTPSIDSNQMLSLPIDWAKPPSQDQSRITELFRSAMGINHSNSSASLTSMSTATSSSSSSNSNGPGSDRSSLSASPTSESNSPGAVNSPDKDMDTIGSTDLMVTLNQAPSSPYPFNENANRSGNHHRRNSDFSLMLEEILYQDASNAIAASISESEIFQTAFQRYLTDQGYVFPGPSHTPDQTANYLKIKASTLRELIQPLASIDRDSKFNFPEYHFTAALYRNALALGFSRSELDSCTERSIKRINESWPPKEGQAILKVRERFGNQVTGGIGPYTYGQGESLSLVEVVEEDERDAKMRADASKREELINNSSEDELAKIYAAKKELRWDMVPPNMYPTRNQILIEHHPWVDCGFPWPSVRELIIFLDAKGVIDEDELCSDIYLSGKYGGPFSEPAFRIWGEQSTMDPEAWELGEEFYKKWYILFDNDILKRTNWWRRARGLAPIVSLHKLSGQPTQYPQIQKKY